MGCQCELHIHPNENEANTNQLNNSSQVNDSCRLQGIKSDLKSDTNSKISEKDKQIKLKSFRNNFQQKLPELGNVIPLNEYNKLITPKINNYIQNNKLNASNYCRSNVSTFQYEPIKFKNNNIYYGNWNDNSQMEGHGIYYLQDRNIITEGVWVKGNIVYGRIFFQNGDIYEGEMKNSLPEGNGHITYKNGDKYIGNFKQGDLNGKGQYIFSDGTKYDGYIENGYFNGKGTMIWDNGTRYDGYFSDSSLCGEGKLINSNGNESYIGNFDKNEFNGKGAYSYLNGDRYEGNFEYGIKRGEGRYFRNDNVEFEGFWNNDLPNGNGIITYRGNSLKGFWRNGIFINSENNGQNLEIFSDIDKDIKPFKTTIIPSSLSHLPILDNNVSQFISGDFI